MKTKLTVTVDEDLLPRAKRAARQRGVSISSVIEQSLRRLAEGEVDFADRWRGQFGKTETVDGSERLEYLRGKYLADPD